MVAASEVKPDANGSAAAVRVKKEYDLPGQTRETPAENDSLRLFYTSLLEQRPDSEMAKKWCVMHGLLPAADAERWAAEQALKKGKAPAVGGGVAKGKAAGGKATGAKAKPAASKATAAKGKAGAAAGKAAATKSAPTKGKAGAASKASPASAKRKAAPKRAPAKKRAALSDDDGDLSDASQEEIMPKPKRRSSGPDKPFDD